MSGPFDSERDFFRGLDAIAPPPDTGQRTAPGWPERSFPSARRAPSGVKSEAQRVDRAWGTAAAGAQQRSSDTAARRYERQPQPRGLRPPDPGPATSRPAPPYRGHPPDSGATRAASDVSSWERMGEELRAAGLTAERRIPAAKGWRKWINAATFGAITIEESPDERRVRELTAVVEGPLRGTHSVVVLGGKGGCGKTTVAIGVGSLFALLRGDKVVAIDGNPAVGANLGERVDPTADSSYRAVLADERLDRYADMRAHLGQSSASGLDVLGADRTVSDRETLDAETYLATHERLQRFYTVLVTDSGANVEHVAVKGLLEFANSIILVASTALDSVQAVRKVMEWLRESGRSELLARSVIVLNDLTGRTDRRRMNMRVEAFSRWMGDSRVFVLPYDPHIAMAGIVDIDQVRPTTRRRLLEITAAVAENFAPTAHTP
jgi:MinD-like ATPase involved in chromosome partitioning or flagellar assembly